MLILADVILRGVPEAQAWLFFAMTLAELGALLFAGSRYGLRHHPVWRLLTLGLFLYVPANIIWYGAPVLLSHALPFPSIADFLYIPAYAIQLAGLVVLIRRAGQGERGEPLDVAIVAIGAGLVFWTLAVEPAVQVSGLSALGKAATVSYPLFDLALLAIAARMIVGSERRVPAFWLIATSVLVQLVSDLGYTTSTLHGTFRYGGWITTGYLIQYACMGAAALHPSARDVTTGVPSGRTGRLGWRIAALAIADAVGPCLLLLPGVRDDVRTLLVVVAGSVALTTLTLLRLTRLMVNVQTYERTQRQLKDAELRYRTLVECMPGVVYIAEFGENGDWIYVSPKIRELLGYTLEEWLAHPAPWSTHVHPDDLEHAIEEEHRCGDAGQPLSSVYRMFTRDGRMLWIHDEAQLVPDEHGEPKHWQGVMTDITWMKDTENQLRAASEERRGLLERLVTAQEEERRRVANDIHDDTIQKMAAVGMRLAGLRARISPELSEQVGALDRTVSLAIGRLRRLMFELRPLALDREGLDAALRQYIADVAEETDLDFEIDNRLASEAPPGTRAAAYRIALEALANVRKHANASVVRVLVEPRDGGLHVRVDDDGIGFVPGAPTDGDREHIGLTAMRERAELAGGWCHVDSVPGRGTVVEFWLPVPQDPLGADVDRAAAEPSNAV